MCMAKMAYNVFEKNPVFQRMRAKMALEAGKRTGGTEQVAGGQRQPTQQAVSAYRPLGIGPAGLAARSLLG